MSHKAMVGCTTNKIRWCLLWLHRIFPYYRRWKVTVSLLLSYPPVLLMKESSGRQFLPPAKGSSCHHPLLYAFKGTLGNGACVLCPKVIVMHGYSHAPQVTDIAGHIISRREVNELHPCVLAVCQYKIVFHFACLLMVTIKCGRWFPPPRTQNSLISAIVVQCVSHSFTQGMLYSEVMTAVCSFICVNLVLS